MSATEQLRWLWQATVAAVHLWDDAGWEALSERHVELARETGALGELPLALSQRVYVHLFAGELTAAASLVDEIQAATEATAATSLRTARSDSLPCGVARPRPPPDRRSRADVTRRGEGVGISVLDWAEAVLYNGLGRYEEARAAALRVAEHPQPSRLELGHGRVDRGRRPSRNTRAGRRCARASRGNDRVSGTDWALGIAARSRALLSEGQVAEDLYVEAIDRLGRCRIAVDLARAHLLYGEWLRRERRRLGRTRGAAGRPRALLATSGWRRSPSARGSSSQATGEHARKRTVDTLDQLTPQESQIARLAAEGNTNREIAAQLFISPSTVEYHLRKAFRKLDVKSRTQLARRMSYG